jgi:DNA-binding NarL/FixJ family response regulator
MRKPEFPRRFKPLTRHSRELREKILASLKRGISQQQISRNLDISLGTVGYHVSVLRKSGAYKR